MLYVVFTEIDDTSIKTFEELPLSEAMYLTDKLERKCREEGKKVNGEFYIIDLTDESKKKEAVYRGTFKFGYYESLNLYHHIKKTIPSIKVSREREHEKVLFLEKLEDETESKYKVDDDPDSYLSNLDRDKISKLKKNQRRMIYVSVIISTIALIIVLILYVIKVNEFEKYSDQAQLTKEQQESLISIYEKGLSGDEQSVVTYLEAKENITDEQKLLLANMLIKEKKFKEVINLYGDVQFVANLVSNSKQSSLQDTINVLKEFDEMYPTNQAKYDLAYYSGRYDLMLKIPEVQMNARRSRMKTYAHLKLGQLEEAKSELANNNNEKLKSQINNYELLEAEISLIEEKINTGNSGDQSISELQQELEEKEKELEEI